MADDLTPEEIELDDYFWQEWDELNEDTMDEAWRRNA